MNNIKTGTKFMVVNYSATAVLYVLFNSAIVAGTISLIAGLSTLLWAVVTACIFIVMMNLRDRIIRQEIADGLHDSVWGKNIMMQRQRERDEVNESHWLTRPLFRLACLTGIHKKR